MKLPWAILVSLGVLAGCRSSQPATNPFLRTTVPPPATGQGAVVVQGEPYSPAPITTTAPPPAVITSPPATMAPPGMAPPMAPPSNNRYAPPGGSFQYNQSSNDAPQTIIADDEDRALLASFTESIENDPDRAEALASKAVAGRSSAVEDALLLTAEPEGVVTAQFVDAAPGIIANWPEQEASLKEKVVLRRKSGPSESSLRIVETQHREADREARDDERPTSAEPVFRVAVEDAAASQGSGEKRLRAGVRGESGARVRFATPLDNDAPAAAAESPWTPPAATAPPLQGASTPEPAQTWKRATP